MTDWNDVLLRYAATYSAFLVRTIDKAARRHIRTILLIGSVPQERASAESDVDMLIDSAASPSNQRRLRSLIAHATDEFLLTPEALLFKARGVYNEIRPVFGNLDQWPDMRRTVAAGSVVLFGAAFPGQKKGECQPWLLFFWEGSGPRRGAFLNKLYGYRVKGKRYPGVLEKSGSIKIGKAAALIPAARRRDIVSVMEAYRVPYKTKEMFV